LRFLQQNSDVNEDRTQKYRAEMEPGDWVTGSAIFTGSGRVSVSDPVFDPVSSFNMHVYRGVVSTE